MPCNTYLLAGPNIREKGDGAKIPTISAFPWRRGVDEDVRALPSWHPGDCENQYGHLLGAQQRTLNRFGGITILRGPCF